ncbi:MAG: SCO family protein [Nevskia sp.]|nr:SCO family protein [Nevskia sp.]
MNPSQPSPSAFRPAPQGGHQRRQFLVMLCIFVLPIVAAYAVFFLFPGLRPTGTTNYGQLVAPARPLPALSLRDAAGEAAAPALFKGKWSLVYLGAAACAEPCRTEIFLARQVRTALDKDAARVQRIYIAPDPASLAAARELLAADHRDLLLLADAGAKGARADEFFQPAVADALYLVDPLGNWMMVYAPRADQVADFKGILKDLKKLLFQSQVD